MSLLQDAWFWICIIVAAVIFGGLWLYQEFILRPQQEREDRQSYAMDGGYQAPIQTAPRVVKPVSTPRPAPSIAYQHPVAERQTPAMPVERAVKVPEIAPAVEVMDFETMWRGLQDATHVLLVGETNAGKSTAANAMIYGRSETDLLCILDPHAEPGDWGGLPAIGAGLNYRAIRYALNTLHQEMIARYARRGVGDKAYPAMTIFIDELPSIMSECPNATEVLGKLLREARKVDMRLVLLTQSTRVKTLGIEGEGDLLDNLRWLVLGDKAIEECKNAATLDRPAAYIHRGKAMPVYTNALKGLSLNLVSADATWPIDLSEEALLKYEATITPKEKGGGFTEQHLKVAAYMAENPNPSIRAVARLLYPDSSGGGDYSAKAKVIMAQVNKVLGTVSDEC